MVTMQQTRENVLANIEAEKNLLGLLMCSSAITDVIELLSPDDFYRESHRAIYSAMLTLTDKHVTLDPVTLANTLEQRNVIIEDERGGFSYLFKLSSYALDMFLNADRVRDYAAIIREKALARRILEANSKVAGLVTSENAYVALEKAEQLFLGLGQTTAKADFTPVSDIMLTCFDRISKLQERGGAIVGIPTGFHDLDRVLGGLRDEKLYMVAGRPGMGKSSWALTVAHHAAGLGKTVGILSLEMSKEEWGERLIAVDAQLDSRRIGSGYLDGDDWQKFIDSQARLSEYPIYIDDSFGTTILDLKSKARRLQAQHGIDLLIVDYLQLMHSDSDELNANEVKELSIIGRGLKELARELTIPVMALAQLNRSVESRQVKIPQLSDLRGSGTLEQDADVVLFLYRDEEYNGESKRKGEADIIVAKHRGGPKGTFVVGFKQDETRFFNLYKPVAEGAA